MNDRHYLVKDVISGAHEPIRTMTCACGYSAWSGYFAMPLWFEQHVKDATERDRYYGVAVAHHQRDGST